MTFFNYIEIYNDKIEQGRFEALMAISNYLHYDRNLSDEENSYQEFIELIEEDFILTVRQKNAIETAWEEKEEIIST